MPGLELTALGSDCGLQDIAMETKPHLEQQQADNLEIKGHSMIEIGVSRLFGSICRMHIDCNPRMSNILS